ncbi:hypothetical protein H7H82_17260 [Mycobacterium heidelbergense]|uniref:hypothetical protein n=1 Tax=Mycobacterium heidelbergense TaxID=53376 RepID=UPI00114DDBBE|nr:hypothetical protein [Mycobacterium heidelbergense]MCV7052319.1 hypothetical protein [Mycobacterium heidelbergense]BBZ52100.1 hypothetical protein MHEI_38170 [Mycobacterium heidelbergense]
MDLAARPHITAGIALTSAAVLAAGPMAQHLPDLHVAQQLRQVSVSAIQLAGAADGLVDLFSGVENELVSLAGGAGAAAVPAATLNDIFSPITQNMVVQTWLQTLQYTQNNLQSIATTFQKLPLPALQQIAANWTSYASLYVGSYQTAAKGALTYFTSTKASGFWPLLESALNNYATGNISGMVANLNSAFWLNPFINIGEPLEKILAIPGQMTQSFTNALNYLTTTGISSFGLDAILGLPTQIATGLGTSLQAASTAWAHGDPVGAITNMANIPGVAVNALINGTNGKTGLLPSVINILMLQTISPAVAKQLVAPNAVNIATGGSLQGALQAFGNQFLHGWPDLTPIISSASTGMTTLLQNLWSQLPSMMSSFGATLATNIGLLITNLLKLL